MSTSVEKASSVSRGTAERNTRQRSPYSALPATGRGCDSRAGRWWVRCVRCAPLRGNGAFNGRLGRNMECGTHAALHAGQPVGRLGFHPPDGVGGGAVPHTSRLLSNPSAMGEVKCPVTDGDMCRTHLHHRNKSAKKAPWALFGDFPQKKSRYSCQGKAQPDPQIQIW